MPGEVLHGRGHQLFLLHPHIGHIHFIIPLVILFHYFISIFLIHLSIWISRLRINKTLPVSISCRIGHFVPHLKYLLSLLVLSQGILSPEPIEERFLVGAALSPFFTFLLLLEEFMAVKCLFIYHVVCELLFFCMNVPHFFSLIHHLEGHWIDQVVGGLVYFNPFLQVLTMIWNILLHHFHYLNSFLLLGLFLFLFIIFKFSHIFCYFSSVSFDVGCFRRFHLLGHEHLFFDAIQKFLGLFLCLSLFFDYFLLFHLIFEII